MFKSLAVVLMVVSLVSCKSAQRGADALSNHELELLVRKPIEKMLTAPRAKNSHFGFQKHTIKH